MSDKIRVHDQVKWIEGIPGYTGEAQGIVADILPGGMAIVEVRKLVRLDKLTKPDPAAAGQEAA